MAVDDRFGTSGAADSADDAFAVTPHNSTNFGSMSRALYVGTGGDITVVMKSGSVVLIPDVPDGALLPVRCSRVNATGTTATGIVAFV